MVRIPSGWRSPPCLIARHTTHDAWRASNGLRAQSYNLGEASSQQIEGPLVRLLAHGKLCLFVFQGDNFAEKHQHGHLDEAYLHGNGGADLWWQ